VTWRGEGSRIPDRVKTVVRRRDQSCRLGFDGCTQRIDEFDHIVPLAVSGLDRRNANHPAALQGVCCSCHRIKTQREAAAGRTAWRRQPERHPGLL
jgi:5-methylcytosine-specific restriction endonuclease McrA